MTCPLLWIITSHKITHYHADKNSVHWDSHAIAWLHLQGRASGYFCSSGPQPPILCKILDNTSAFFLSEHLDFILKERRMCEDMVCIQVPFCYRGICHIAEIQAVICLWSHWRSQLILRMNTGQTLLNTLEQLSGYLNSVWWPCPLVQTQLSNEQSLR